MSDFERKITQCFDETNSVTDGTIKIDTHYPSYDDYEMVFSGPHIYVGNPLYKNPRISCVNKADYDTIDLCSINDNYLARTKFTRAMPVTKYKNVIDGFSVGQDKDGCAKNEQWIDYYKVGMRKMLNLGDRRSLNYTS